MKNLIRGIRIKHVLLLIGFVLLSPTVCLFGTVYLMLFIICFPFVKLAGLCLWIYNGDTIDIERYRIKNIINEIEEWMTGLINKNLNRLPECDKCAYYRTYNPGGGLYHYTFCGYPNREDQDFPLKQQLFSDPGFRLKCFKCRD